MEGGELISLVLGFALVELGLGLLGKARAPVSERPDATETWHWFFAWLAIAVWALLGPKYSEATLWPASVALIAGALPYLSWLAHVRILRLALIALVVMVHAIVWTVAITTYAPLGREGWKRLALLERGPVGEVAVVPASAQQQPSFWSFGEDLNKAGPRQTVAIDAFGLRDIELEPETRRYEPNAGVEVRLELTGVSEADQRQARLPGVWATDISVARHQFEGFAERLRAVTGHDVEARLVAEHLAPTRIGNRPILVAWAEHGTIVSPKITRAPGDANDRFALQINGPAAQLFTEAWLLHRGTATSVPYLDGHPRIQPMVSDLHVLVACDPLRCLVVDALVPRF